MGDLEYTYLLGTLNRVPRYLWEDFDACFVFGPVGTNLPYTGQYWPGGVGASAAEAEEALKDAVQPNNNGTNTHQAYESASSNVVKWPGQQ